MYKIDYFCRMMLSCRNALVLWQTNTSAPRYNDTTTQQH